MSAVWAIFLYGCPKTSFVGLDVGSDRFTSGIRQSGESLTITASLERVWPFAIADDMLGKMRASLNLSLQKITFVEEQDERGIRQQFIRDD